MPDADLIRKANRLYWETEVPVSEIADQLVMSRRALYDAIEPRPAGLACPECGITLVFRNRTAADRRQAECLECELEVDPGEVDRPEVDADETAGARAAEPQVEQERVASRLSPMARRPPAGTGAGGGLATSLLAGLATGALAGYLIRRR